MTVDVILECKVDPGFLDTVEQECVQILYQQRLLYNERWYSSLLYAKVFSILSLMGVVVSALGIILCIFYLVYPGSCPRWFCAECYLFIFVSTALLFYFLPVTERRFIAVLKNRETKVVKKWQRDWLQRHGSTWFFL